MKYIKKSNKTVYFEIAISILIIFIMIIISAVIFTNIYINSLKVTINTEATSIMTNMLENMKKRTFKEFETYVDELSTVGILKRIENQTQYIYVNGGQLQEKIFGTDIPKEYNLTIQISNTDKNFDLAKDIDITISRTIFKKLYSLNMHTLIEREKIKEVNEPIINNEYFNFLNINIDDYDIVPIKYSKTSNCYVETTVGDQDWYNYDSKEWARVLVFAKEGYVQKSMFIDFNGNVSRQINYNGTILDLNNYMYTWIPNFSVKDNVTFFRYGSGKNSIKLEYLNENGKYLYFYSVSDEIENISLDCSFDGVAGVWKSVLDNQDIYYKTFNNTKYGPINLH